MSTNTPAELDNPLIKLLVKLEQASRCRQSEIQADAANRLLDNSKFCSEILRARFSDPRHVAQRDLTFSAGERRDLRGFASEKTRFPNSSVSGKVYGAMVLATSEVDKEVLQCEAEDYIERGGSFIDWHRHGDLPLDEDVLSRIEAKLSDLIEKPRGALRVFIIRTIEGRAAKHEDVRRALDRLVREGFYEELLRDVWERYPIEADILTLPKPTESDAGRTGEQFEPWCPPTGYVGVKEIKAHERFRKLGKNPSRTTIQKWVEKAMGDADPQKRLDIATEPSTNEHFYPENWVV